MTDSGFSSAASQRSTSSILRPTHINSFSSSLKPNLLSIPSENEDDNNKEGSLPKPCMQFPSNGGRPVIPNRLLYGKNHGGYSPGLSPFSSHGMSPVSSLAYDFKDLNTSQNSSITPRKRLSLSSVSSLDSPHPSGSSFFGCSNLSHISPAPSSTTPNVTSPNEHGITDDGCFPETPTPTDQDDKDGKHVRNLSQEHHEEEKSGVLRRFKSVPSSKARFRLLGVKENSENSDSDKENEGKPSGRFTRHRTTGFNMVASPMGLSDNFSPIGTGKTFTRPQQGGLYNMMSSPLVNAFSHGKSSAFKTVSPNEVAPKPQRRILGDIDANVPQPSFSPAQPIKMGGVKRLLDESANSSAITVARKRKCSKSLNAKTAFLQERKTKSADAILTGNRPLPTFANDASPTFSRNFMYRPISAPILMGNDGDDDYVLSHSSLCSHDSDEEDFKKNLSEDDFASVSSCKEDDIEHMMCENMKIFAGPGADFSSTSDTPTALDGLISGPLLLANHDTSIADSDANDSLAALGCAKKNVDEVKPRELFRSPSAPPLVLSRRTLNMKLKRAVRNTGESSTETTPVSIKRPRTYASLSDALEAQPKEVIDPGLNRSRSYNELDVMKAVDHGCEDASLVGDFSRACTLPTVAGRKQDLKYITPKTLVDTLNKTHDVGMVEVVDCRYTYEYEGGHVDGAVNVWTEEQLIERYFNCAKPMWARAKQHQAQFGENKPHVLIFHCEFSSERGPKLARFLRNYDRTQNVYPKLHYPEIYVLKDGYKEFFKVMKEHCEPSSYVPMSHEAYASELRKFRIKSKTWAGERSKHGLFNRLKNQ